MARSSPTRRHAGRLITARAVSVLALVGACPVAASLSGDRARVGSPIAASVAVISVLLTQDFLHYWFRGTRQHLERLWPASAQ